MPEMLAEAWNEADAGDTRAGRSARRPVRGKEQEFSASTCFRCALTAAKSADPQKAIIWLQRLADADEAFAPWHAGGKLLQRLEHALPSVLPRARVWIASSYTTTQLAPLLALAALRHGVMLDVIEGAYGQLRQDMLDANSPLLKARPDIVLMAVHAGDVSLPDLSSDPTGVVERELEGWRDLWRAYRRHAAGRVVMHNFALPIDNAFGHLAERLPGARVTMLRHLNRRLGEAAAESGIALVDCEMVSALIGKRGYFNDRYWRLSRQAVSLEALPLLAKHTAAVIASTLGLSKKCLVLDLDNTLWGGVVGEEGAAGVRIGPGDPAGEAFTAFQRYVKSLQDRGVILAVCSKNNAHDAEAPFRDRPDMVLKLEDFAAFVANWETKPSNLREIARKLGIGLDAIAFADDNPAERELVRQALPEVAVVELGSDPSRFVRDLAECLWFEPASFTAEDAERTALYRARAASAEAAVSAETLDDYYRALRMEAVIAPVDAGNLARVVQLINKTNQFNLTTRRYNEAEVRALLADPGALCLTFRLKDRFTDHGLVAVLIARRDAARLRIEAWLMSCRVIGRTLERTMFAALCEAARTRGCEHIEGLYRPTAKNGLVRDLYADLGFERGTEIAEGAVPWTYNLTTGTAPANAFVRVADIETPIKGAPA